MTSGIKQATVCLLAIKARRYAYVFPRGQRLPLSFTFFFFARGFDMPSIKRHMLVAVLHMFSSNGPSAVNNMKTEPAITSWKILHYQRWQLNLRSHCRQTVACYSPLFSKF